MARAVKRRGSGHASAPLRGTVNVPGDLGISRAALAVAALAEGRSTVRGVNAGSDVQALARALTALGARCELLEPEDPRATVEVPPEGLHEPDEVLNAGVSAGSVATLLALCSTLAGMSVVTGDGAVREVPILGVVSRLRQMGAAIDGRGYASLVPLVVRGGALVGLEHELSGRAPDAKTAVVLAAVRADGQTSIVERVETPNDAAPALEAAGARVHVAPRRIVIDGGATLHAMEHDVPGDLSAAVALAVAATLLGGSDMTVADVGVDETRTGALAVLDRMGAATELVDHRERSGHLVGAFRVRAAELQGTEVDEHVAQRVVDDLPVLIVAATQAQGETTIALPSLERHERDSLDLLVRGLHGLGADVELAGDAILARGPASLGAGEVDSGADPRLAVAFAVAGLVSPERVRVKRWACMNAWFPDFADVVARARRGR